jgi:hypothetical protein
LGKPVKEKENVPKTSFFLVKSVTWYAGSSLWNCTHWTIQKAAWPTQSRATHLQCGPK